MSRQMLLQQTPFRITMLSAVALLTFLPKAAWCQTNSLASAPSAQSPASIAEKSGHGHVSPAAPKPVTVDPDVTIAHLKLLVKPLTLDELEVEAQGWQNLLRENVQQITRLHLRIEQITEQLASLKATSTSPPKQSSRSAPAPPSENPQPAEADKHATPHDGTATTQRTSPELPSTNTGTNSADVAPKSSTASTSNLTPNSTDPPTVESLTQQRTQLSSQLTELTLNNSEISQKFDIVLNNLELKGGDATSYRKYNAALTGVALEVTTASGMWQMFSGWLVAEQGGKRWAWNLVRFIVILLVSYFGASILANFVRRGASRVKGVSQLLVNFLSSFTKQVSMVVGFIIGLAALEIDITPLLAAVGAAGFVVAFALQGTLSNFASGLLILAYRPFDVGDVIEAASVSGSVDSVSLFSTHIRTFDNKLMIVPNNDIWGGTITNATASTTRRVDLVFGIGYADDINQAKRILTNIVENHPLVLKEPAVNIRVNELGDSSVNLICRPWTKTENYWSVYWDLMQAVKQEFDSAGVSIPFPQRDVHVYQHNSTDQSI